MGERVTGTSGQVWLTGLRNWVGEGGGGTGNHAFVFGDPRLTFLESLLVAGGGLLVCSAAHLRGRQAQQLSMRMHEKRRWCQQVQIN